MPLLELVGPPAVGKSTLVAAAVRRGATDVRRSLLVPRHRAVAALADWARRSAASGGSLAPLAGRLLVDPGSVRTEAALTAAATGWRDLLTLVLEGPGGPPPTTPEGLALAVVERGWLLDAIRLRALVATLPAGAGVALLDEGLTHPYKALAAVGDDPTRLARYAAVVPLPDVLVVVGLDPAEHARRVRARHHAMPGRVRWTALGGAVDDEVLDAELARVRRTVDVIAGAAADRGTPVIRLDATGRTPDELALELLDRAGTAVG